MNILLNNLKTFCRLKLTAPHFWIISLDYYHGSLWINYQIGECQMNSNGQHRHPTLMHFTLFKQMQ